MSLSSSSLVWSGSQSWTHRSVALACGFVMLLQGVGILAKTQTTHVAAAGITPTISVVSLATHPDERLQQSSPAHRRSPRVVTAQSGQSRTEPNTCVRSIPAKPSRLVLSRDGLTQVVDAPRYYPIYGYTVDQIRDQLSACAPTDFPATTSYDLGWSYSTHGLGDGRCALTHIRVGMHVAVQYPEWLDYDSAGPAIRARWQQFATSLRRHEQHHVSENLQAARSLLSALRAVPAGTCRDVTATAAAITRSYRSQLDATHRALDADTNHGQTQGAWL